MPARLLMIALDGADSKTLERMSSDGGLPNLTRLRERGVAGSLSSPNGITDDGIWASIQYGSGLGDHGRYFFLQQTASGRMAMRFHEEAEDKAFWDRLSDAGNRVAIFDIPKCRTPRPLNGLHLCDWIVHGHYFGEPQSYPPELASEVVSAFGPELPSRCGYEFAPFDECDVDATRNDLLASIERKSEAARAYLRSDDWDLFFVGFKEAHCAGHSLWTENAPEPGVEIPIETVLHRLDTAIGDLVKDAENDARIMVFTTTEMVANASIEHLMPALVVRLNRALSSPPFAMWGEKIRSKKARRFYRRLFGKPLLSILPYNEDCAALRINVSPAHAERREDIADRSIRLLSGIVDTATGEPVIAAIDQPSRQYRGARSGLLPDLLVRLVPGAIPSSVSSPALGRIAAKPPLLRPGNHAGNGYFIATGADMDAARLGELSGIGSFCESVLSGRPESLAAERVD